MSLINKMLQDLEQRHAEDTAGRLPREVRAAPVVPRRAPWMAIASLVVILLCAAASWLWLRPMLLDRHGAAAPAPAALPAAPEAAVTSLPTAPAVPAALAPKLVLKVDDDLRVSSAAQTPPVAEAAPAAALRSIAEPSLQESRAATAQNPKREADARTQVEAPVQEKNAPDRRAQSKPVFNAQPLPAESVLATNAASGKAAASEPAITLNKQVRELTPQQKAENSYRHATTLIQQGRLQEAGALLEQALQTDPANAGARQTLIALMLNAKRRDDAMRLAQQGLELDARQTNFAMILARLQLDKGEQKAAIATLQRSLPAATSNAEYQAFLAALMQREGRHADAINLYEAALDKEPQSGVWWMGLGISLQADNRPKPARDAFIHARESATLTPDLQAFVEQKIRQLAH